jgi:hypothetical protein
VEVELQTPVGRYIQDKQISEAIAPMLTAVGIRTRVLTPEWPTLWDNVQAGKVPFYYMGRGSVLDPGLPLAQYFETGVTPRIGYSNPALDALFAKERSAFDPTERKHALSELMSLITDEAPAHFLWTHKMLWGMSRNIEYDARPDTRIFASEIRVNLSAQEQARLANRHPINPEAYMLYLKGRYHWNKRSLEGFQKAIEYFQLAAAKDPAYALAYVGLADTYTYFSFFDVVPPREAMPKAKAAAGGGKDG